MISVRQTLTTALVAGASVIPIVQIAVATIQLKELARLKCTARIATVRILVWMCLRLAPFIKSGCARGPLARRTLNVRVRAASLALVAGVLVKTYAITGFRHSTPKQTFAPVVLATQTQTALLALASMVVVVNVLFTLLIPFQVSHHMVGLIVCSGYGSYLDWLGLA